MEWPEVPKKPRFMQQPTSYYAEVQGLYVQYQLTSQIRWLLQYIKNMGGRWVGSNSV